MNRFQAATFLVLVTAMGCSRVPGGAPGTQREERRELGRRQAQERGEQVREQAEDRAEARAATREALPERTAEVRDQRADLNAASARLQESIALACQGTSAPNGCPIDNANLRSVDDSASGLSLVMAPEAGGAAEILRNIECYRARTSLRPTPEEGACIVDVMTGPDVTVHVRESGENVVVDLVSADTTRIGRIRSELRRVLESVRPRRVSARQ